MQKSIYSEEYAVLLQKLREARESAGLTQSDAADRMGVTQSFVSKCERGERRLDVIELRDWCRSIGASFAEFSQELDRALLRRGRR
jgi:transcriptional regulator with XRE-family HTH domain